MRGADLLVNTLSAAGVERLFTLSGNQIMPIFDACVDADIDLVHTRHEAAAIHMADAWGRLTGDPGVAAVTAGPGMANTLSALYVALMSESPLVVISGHAPVGQIGRGAFQEMAQSEMARHVAKASWTSQDALQLGEDIARAFRIARSGRPGPVHIAVPFDLQESSVDGAAVPPPDDFYADSNRITDADSQAVLDAVAEAKRPLILAGSAMMRGAARQLLSALAEAIHAPAVFMESPRGINDPSLGAFAEPLAEADLIVLIGKELDFTMQFGSAPAVSPECRFVQVDSEDGVLDRTKTVLGDPARLAIAVKADPVPATQGLVEMASRMEWPNSGWSDEVQDAVTYRPAEWRELESPPEGPLHAVEVSRVVQEFLDRDPQSVFIADGGEFGQWVQSCVSSPRRVINGPGGSIGTSIPFAIAASLAYPDSRVVTLLGDGTFGFHGMEIDTAVRHNIPFIALIGNDAAWNAEYQIQLREYGPERAIGCELFPSRYDQVAEALGGHGENVTKPAELAPALERALASGLPACVNVAVQRTPAPVVRRTAAQQAGAGPGH